MMKYLMMIMSAVIFCSCGNSSSGVSTYGSSESTSGYNNATDEVEQQMYVCPMCNGTGVFEYMPGDVMAPSEICSGCNGNKVVTGEQAEAIMRVNEQADAFVNGRTVSGGGYSSGGSGRSAYEIEQDLRKAYELLEDMEYNYENCTGVVAASQYPGIIAEQKARINRLEEELRNAQY